MSKPKAPAPPDYAAAATAQGAANTTSAMATNFLNQADQVNPYGSMSYDYDYGGGQTLPDGTVIPKTTVTTALSPEQQRLLDQNTGLSTQLNDLAARGIGYVDEAATRPFDTSGLPDLSYGPEGTAFRSGIAAPTQSLVSGVGTFNPQMQANPTNLNMADGFYGEQYRTSANPTNLSIAGMEGLDPNGNLSSWLQSRDPQMRYDDAGQIQSNYDFSGVSAMPKVGDFSAQRDQITDAMMQRLQPYIDKERAALDTQMTNQGLGIGSEARTWEQDRFQRGVNDQRIAALLGGDQEAQRLFENSMGIRQQGVGEAMSQGNFANNAQQEMFNQLRARSGDYNAAQSQAFGQDLAGGQFRNQADAQRFSQTLAALGFGNQAQAQEFGQNQQEFQNFNYATEAANALRERQASFANDAQSQLFGQNQQELENYNSGQQNLWQQAMMNAQFANQTQGTQFAQNQAEMDAYNRAQEAAFSQGLAGSQFSNQARQQAIQEADYYRNAPLNMLNALRSGNQVTAPQFGDVMGGSVIQPPPLYQATADQYGAELDRYQSQLAGFSALLGGLGSIGGAAVGKWG